MKIFLRDVGIHFGQNIRLIRRIKIYPVDDGENFQDWVSIPMFFEARKETPRL